MTFWVEGGGETLAHDASTRWRRGLLFLRMYRTGAASCTVNSAAWFRVERGWE